MQSFILAHRNDDIRTLALQASRYPEIDMPAALQQISGWQRAKTKLPQWAATEGIIFPPQISMEQCSSEQTALYKARILKDIINLHTDTTQFIDLTGGFGVDFSYMARGSEEDNEKCSEWNVINEKCSGRNVINEKCSGWNVLHSTYIERQPHLCDIARHNFTVLGLTHAEVINTEAEEYLNTLTTDDAHHRILFLDPARRDTHGRKTYAISDCTPDVVQLLPRLKSLAHHIILKLSPMLDISETIRLLPGTTDVHILSVRNECKEVVVVIDSSSEDTQKQVTLHCVNDNECFEAPFGSETYIPAAEGVNVGDTIFVPNASIMKGGCFGAMCEKFGLHALDHNTHIYNIYKGTREGLPGRTFQVEAITTLNKKDLKLALQGITKANIACRNFPLSAEELRRRLKIHDGGDTYIFGTTVNEGTRSQHLVLICKKS